MVLSFFFVSLPKIINMLKSVSTCLSCENLIENFKCKIHDLEVELNNVCDSHVFKPFLTKESSCNNCDAAMSEATIHGETISWMESEVGHVLGGDESIRRVGERR